MIRVPTIPPISSRVERYVRFLRRRARWILAATLLLCTASAIVASRLELRTDLSELLPSADPGVQELHRLQPRLPGMNELTIVVHSPDRARNLAFAQRVVERVRALPPDLVQTAAADLRAEHAWFEAHKWLYAKLGDLEHARDQLAREIQKRKNPLFVDLDDDAPRLDENKLSPPNLKEDFVTADGQSAMVLVVPPGGLFREHAGERLVARVQKILAELKPAEAGVTVGLTGDIQTAIEERAALEHDLILATVICVLLVCAVVVAFFRRLRAVPLMALPALCGTCVAFAVAELAFGYLNSSTAFLGSIIIGNGINFAIILLARYDEERAMGVHAEVALTRAVAGTWRATVIAALGAGVAYGSLVLTRFRGFSQFGVIGGVGMVLAWVATVTVLPSMIWLLDRKPRRCAGTLPRSARKRVFADFVARVATSAPKRLLVAGALISIAAVLVLPRYLRDPFEYDFRHLRSVAADQGTGWARFADAHQEVFGNIVKPAVIVVDRDEQVASTRHALEQADRRASGPRMIDRVVTLDDLVPGTPPEQRRKLEVLAEIRNLTHDSSFQLLDDDERARVTRYLPPDGLAPVTASDLPASVRRPFTETDGTTGHVVLVVPREQGFSPWNGRDLIRLSARVTNLPLPDGHIVRSASPAVVFASMISAIVHDGPRATLASAIGVILLVLVLARRGAWLVIGTLAAGLLWMMGAAAALGLHLNFLNFVAIPITLGIGVDYGINIYMRNRLEGPGRLRAAVRATGGAVALCSATTIIGYGTLLVAANRGLRSFGALAIIGEIACLSAALLLLPAILALRERQLARRRFLDAA